MSTLYLISVNQCTALYKTDVHALIYSIYTMSIITCYPQAMVRHLTVLLPHRPADIV